mgnify:CR=1 FL=1
MYECDNVLIFLHEHSHVCMSHGDNFIHQAFSKELNTSVSQKKISRADKSMLTNNKTDF